VATRRYRLDEVSRALDDQWGHAIRRGRRDDDPTSRRHDGRWDVTHSRTGYVVSGRFPGYSGVRHAWFRSLADVVRCFDLAATLRGPR
jgi:hypothetical protein